MTLSIHLGKLGSAGSCVYRRGDMTLEYVRAPDTDVTDLGGCNTEQGTEATRQRNTYYIAGTMTLIFGGVSRALIGLDAYTSSKLWTRREHIPLPAPCGTGELRLTDLPDGEDRVSLDVEPLFEYCEESRVLRISFGAVDGLAYCRVCKDVIVGITPQQLGELYLLEVTEMA